MLKGVAMDGRLLRLAHEGETMEASNIQVDAEFSPAEWKAVYKCFL
jgi:hypothetical protein